MAQEALQPDNPRGARRIRIEPASGWAELNLRELWAYRDLLLILALRDIKLRYKQTALGVVWVILQPLVAAGIFSIIFGRFANLPSDGVPYLLFVYTGLLAWNLFANALQRAGNSLVGGANLVSKVYFPRMIIPLASTAGVLLDFLVALAVVLALLAVYAWPITLNVLALPLLVAVALLISVAVSLFVSALNVYYRDFTHALPFVIQVWMYASPVVYSAQLIPAPLRLVFAINPIVGVIDGFRWAILGVGTFPWLTFGISIVGGSVLFLVAALVFNRVERSFADVI